MVCAQQHVLSAQTVCNNPATGECFFIFVLLLLFYLHYYFITASSSFTTVVLVLLSQKYYKNIGKKNVYLNKGIMR